MPSYQTTKVKSIENFQLQIFNLKFVSTNPLLVILEEPSLALETLLKTKCVSSAREVPCRMTVLGGRAHPLLVILEEPSLALGTPCKTKCVSSARKVPCRMTSRGGCDLTYSIHSDIILHIAARRIRKTQHAVAARLHIQMRRAVFANLHERVRREAADEMRDVLRGVDLI